jgi:mono/diheme cytochrome c family protein
MKSLKILIFLIAVYVVQLGCNYSGRNSSGTGTAGTAGTAWAPGSFSSNGERIYYTGTSDSGTPITYTGGPMMGMMMMGGNLACVSCHGTDARGGRHMMHMEIMDAPDIRWSALASGHHDEEGAMSNDQHHHDEYNFEDFKNSVENGKHPDGKTLSEEMPRWQMSDTDLRDLMNYLKSFQ